MNAHQPDMTLDALFEFVRDTRGFDFTGYKRSTIQRRVAKRLTAVGVERYDDYADYLELHAEEFGELFNTLLINTTGFFAIPRPGSTSPPRSHLSCWPHAHPTRRCVSGAPVVPQARSRTPSQWCSPA